jgi:ABC-type bacteriocin/lantibiotic exporter with double-glycine peptidase domain
MPMMMSNASQYIAMFIAAFAVMDNTITLGMLFVMSSYIGSSSMPLEGLTYLLVRINASSQLFSRLNEYIVKVESKDEYDTMVIDKLIEQKIQIYKTSICNPSGETLFYIDQLTIDKPGLYQLAGVNGSGKTTLINLITNNAHSDGFCIHENGYVKINKNIVNNTAHYYSSNLFISGSVKENIVINHTYDQNHFEKITMLLNIDFLDKQVDPNNLNLSLGESAKISLARIFIKNHELILLDEPFTNIDINTTKKLVNYIKKLSEKCPIIVISHDDSVKSICEHYFEIVDKKLINR